MKNLPIKPPQDSIVVTIGMANRLDPGETITSCTFSVDVSLGTDPNPSAMVGGAADITAAPLCACRIQGGIHGCTYVVSAICQTNQGNTKTGTASLPVFKGGA